MKPNAAKTVVSSAFFRRMLLLCLPTQMWVYWEYRNVVQHFCLVGPIVDDQGGGCVFVNAHILGSASEKVHNPFANCSV